MELERRTRIKNEEEIKKNLEQIGAKKVNTKNQIDTYYGSIELYKKIGYSFVTRIRESNGKFILTVKTAKPKKNGVWEEYEKEIDDPKMFESMFLAMGFEKIIKVEKEREMFKLNNITINFDHFKERGSFLEIELISENQETKELDEFMLKLGITSEDIIDVGYISLFLKENNSKFCEFVKN